jgi:O-6-methylguanine DNA methyltransferase
MKYNIASSPEITVFFVMESGRLTSIQLVPDTAFTLAFKGSDSTIEDQAERFMRQYAQKQVIGPWPLKNQVQAPIFTKKVWQCLLKIPFGSTMSYAGVAKKIGHERAMRAVGNACGKNPFPLLIPCHRVLAKGFHLGGFSSGREVKLRLLRHENVFLA